jgi:hypothetical protein
MFTFNLERTRFFVGWGIGYFGNPPSSPQGTNLRTPTRIAWDDSLNLGLNSRKFEDVASPDDGSFVILLTSTYPFY